MFRGRFLLPQLRRRGGARTGGEESGLVRSEGGFTLVELMIASGTVLTSLTLIAGVLTSGLSAAGVSRERQSSRRRARFRWRRWRAA
jgi:type II secretory pathway component PulJ